MEVFLLSSELHKERDQYAQIRILQFYDLLMEGFNSYLSGCNRYKNGNVSH